jgi:proteasome lid subunit RPN8/RPN11
MPIHLAFIDAKTERRFARTVIGQREEIGGILFWDWGQINHLHYRRHRRLFGVNSIGLIRDWIICPNVSSLPDRMYQVGDLDMLIGIAEQTEQSRGCQALHFHTHPNGSTTPSQVDLGFWKAHFGEYGIAHGVVVAESDRAAGFALACHSIRVSANKYETGRFLNWRWINYLIRRDEKARAVKHGRT